MAALAVLHGRLHGWVCGRPYYDASSRLQKRLHCRKPTTHHLCIPLERPSERRLESRRLVGPSDESREAARPGNFDWSMQSADPSSS